MTLKERIASLIAVQGPISVAQYMTLALHDPQSGYYATRDPLGKGGDFITAPEISQMFGEMLGLWLAEAWEQQGRPQRPVLMELGPGRGTLMADILRTLKAMPDFRKQLDVVLVEASAHLKRVQEETLKSAGVPLRWQSQFEGEAGRPLFLVANEFFDALPIRQYVKTPRGWCERMVMAQNGGLNFALAPLPAPASLIPESRAGAPDGGFYETAPAAIALAEAISRHIEGNGGAALLIDYGYGRAGFGETLQAVTSHGFAGVLTEPGKADLSAHVDFTALAEAGRRGGAGVHGPIAQGELLKSLGIAARAEALATRHLVGEPALQTALARLTEDEAMGQLFKALAFLPSAAMTAPAFAEADHAAA
ncbi:MAG: SAM-dependent methyltransferase [Alphaproteobacteria bacterium]|nr:SAM-dependent methyltransferase [Alphaproteobacteria bacterium]